MSNKYILAIDQGTTSTKAIIFDQRGNIISSALREVQNIFPHPGWVEVDPMKLWVSVVDVINEALILGSLQWSDIDSIGITNQRETVIVWDKNTGKPVYNGIIWQSRQTLDICDKLKKHTEEIFKKTGLFINPYFSASKIRWILNKISNGQKRAEKGDLMCGTVDTWLIYKLTNQKVFATDYTNASRTLLFNIRTLTWDDKLLKLFNIPKKMLPKVCDSSYDYGKASFFSNCNAHITGVAGDQQASLFGQRCFKEGQTKTTYGTGAFILANIGNKLVLSKNKLLTTIAWKIGKKVTYCLEGSVFICGSVVTWLRDGMKIIKSTDEVEKLALSVKDTGGVYIVPAFTGLGAPYWNNHVRGAIFGVSRGTTGAHIARACIESMAYQVEDVIDTLSQEVKIDRKHMNVDGGECSNNLLLQFQSNISRSKIKLPKMREVTALGVCYLAGLHTGYFSSMEAITKLPSIGKEYSPQISIAEAKGKSAGWKQAVEADINFKV